VELLTPNPEIRGGRIPLGGWSWLNGNGLTLEVTGDPIQGLTLPMQVRVESLQMVPA
jgi:hypothetical protein